MKEQVTQILRDLAEQEVPASLDLWPAIQARLPTQRRASRWARFMPATRLGWTFLVLVLSLALGAVAYAVGPIVMSRLFHQEAGLRHIEQASLVQEINLSQTIDDVTVTLERAYADANRIVVGFTIRGGAGQQYDPRQVTLTDAAGPTFPEGPLMYGVTGQSDILEVELPPGEGGYVVSFDAAAIQGTPPALHLRLTMELEEFVLPPPAPEPSPSPDGSLAEPPAPMIVVLEPLPASEGTIVGPFTFDFSVPFIPGHTVEVQQPVEAAGVTVRLERVVVTPSETRVILCFEPPEGDSKDWGPITTLDAGDGQDLSGGAVSQLSGTGEEICYRHIYLDALTGRSGTWTLTVTELVGEDINQLESQILRQADSAVVSVDAVDAKFQTRLAGPWVFHFVVP